MLMKKTLIFFIILTLTLTPSLVLASPGLLDQYGGHICQIDCSSYQLENGQYHYHDFPASPSYLSGNIAKPQDGKIFYLPYINPVELTSQQISFLGNPPNELRRNPEIDKRFCSDVPVFAYGLYDSKNRARIKPICVNEQIAVKADIEISPVAYYQAIPDPGTREISKVYHVTFLKDGRQVFTDHPDIEELKGKIIQGVTDSVLYYINRYDNLLTLRPITDAKARFMYGDDYSSQILYFDDSIVYSYKIGQPLY